MTIFLGIFIGSAPFLLVGSLVSGLIAVFVDQGVIDRYLPRRRCRRLCPVRRWGSFFRSVNVASCR
ncbi:MAG: hypothetical protein R3E79_44765 [Caldilineaceae bacterium]